MRIASRNAAPLRSVPDQWCFATDASAGNCFDRSKKMARAEEPASGECPARALIEWPRWPLASLASAAIADHHCKKWIRREFPGVGRSGVITPR